MRTILSRVTRATIFACSIASLLPLIACWPLFLRLFFFNDDWEMFDGATRLGLGRWLAEPFLGEGMFPLFKLLWLGAVRLTGGSYFGMILLVWTTHLAICLLFGWLLARCELPAAAIAFALLTFGLSWTNLETLVSPMQWNAQLAIVFFLAAWHFALGTRQLDGRAAGCFFCLLLSGLCSTRGIVSGLVLAIFVLARDKGGERLRLMVLCLAPTTLLVAAMLLFTPHHGTPKPVAALLFGLDYLLSNPLFTPLPPLRKLFGAGAPLACGALKTAVIVWAFRSARPATRTLLWTLGAFDLIVAASLGYSRSYTGLAATTGSRYQYISLLCFVPFAGILVARLRIGARVAVLLMCAAALAFPWKRHAEQWAGWRGDQLRTAIEHSEATQHFDPSSVTAGRARELVRLYGLH
jgi:hypothetical protein